MFTDGAAEEVFCLIPDNPWQVNIRDHPEDELDQVTVG